MGRGINNNNEQTVTTTTAMMVISAISRMEKRWAGESLSAVTVAQQNDKPQGGKNSLLFLIGK